MKQVEQVDIMQWLDHQFSTSDRRNAAIEFQYSQVSRQNGTMINMLSSLLGECADEERERYRKIILDWKKDRDDRRKPKAR